MQAEAAEQRPSSEEELETAVSRAENAVAAALESAEAALVSVPDETAEVSETVGVAPPFEAWESVGGRDEAAPGVWRDDGGEVFADLRQLQNTGGNYQVDLVSFYLVLAWVGLGLMLMWVFFFLVFGSGRVWLSRVGSG